MRADIRCECGYKFSSGLQDAIDACNVVRLEKGLEPVKFGRVESEQPAPVYVGGGLKVPQPSLPVDMVPRHAGMAPVGSMVGRMAKKFEDFKARQSGERDPGEEG